MIELSVAPYCHDCLNFEAETSWFPVGNGKGRFIVRCNKSEFCNKICTYLEEKMKGENSNGC